LLQRFSLHDFAPQHNYDYTCVTPAEWIEATPKGMQCNNTIKYRLAFSGKPLQLRVSLSVYGDLVRRLLQKTG